MTDGQTVSLPPSQLEIMGEWFRDKFVALAEQIKAMPKTLEKCTLMWRGGRQ